MKIKANVSFIGKNGLTMTAGETVNATPEEAAWATKLKLAAPVAEPAPGPADEPEKKLPSRKAAAL